MVSEESIASCFVEWVLLDYQFCAHVVVSVYITWTCKKKKHFIQSHCANSIVFKMFTR